MSSNSGEPKRPTSNAFQQQKFKPGESGNIKGRPPGSKNRLAVIRKVLGEEVTAQIGGRRTKMPSTVAALQVLKKKALEKDLPSIKLVMQLWFEAEEAAEAAGRERYPFSDADHEVLSEIHARMRACQEEPDQ